MSEIQLFRALWNLTFSTFEHVFPAVPFKMAVVQAADASLIIIIIIINLFIEGSLISAKALFCLRALFGATRIHSCTRMASWI